MTGIVVQLVVTTNLLCVFVVNLLLYTSVWIKLHRVTTNSSVAAEKYDKLAKVRHFTWCWILPFFKTERLDFFALKARHALSIKDCIFCRITSDSAGLIWKDQVIRKCLGPIFTPFLTSSIALIINFTAQTKRTGKTIRSMQADPVCCVDHGGEPHTETVIIHHEVYQHFARNQNCNLDESMRDWVIGICQVEQDDWEILVSWLAFVLKYQPGH